MEYLAKNWYILLACCAAVAVIIVLVVKFFKKPRAEQIAKIKEWLLYAVTEAEKELGSGTGQLKLRFVYDKFVSKFPYLVQFVSFEMFSGWVDEVLIKFKELFKSNVAVKQYVDTNMVLRKEDV